VKSLTLKQLKEDKEKVIHDIRRMQEQLIGAQYILSYINQTIEQLKPNNQEVCEK
jgi:hypothetical protein